MKRAAAAILALVMALGLTGCASIFDKSYFSSSEYVSETREAYASGSVEVSSYLELTLAINNLVSEHEDSLTIHFTAYEGDMQEDLAAACREVSTDTALGAYAVDYITYDLDRIVAYYEAEVYVYYKRSAEELDEIVSVNTADDLYNAICGMLEELDTRLVAMVGASSVDEEAVLGYVDEAYFSDPLSCVERPEATVNVYTGGGFQRIVELGLIAIFIIFQPEIRRLLERMGSGKFAFFFGAPGVPGGTVMASLGLITGVLLFDATGTGLMLTIFALQDSFGTACNVTGDGALTLILTGYAEKHHIEAES